MKKSISLLLMLVGSVLSLNAQSYTPESFGFKPYSFKDNELGTVNYYVTLNKIETPKPLLVYIDGSSATPIFSVLKKPGGSTRISSGIPFNIQKLSDQFHIVVISKPGMPFVDSLQAKSMKEFKKNYKLPMGYKNKLSHSWRVNSASKIIDILFKELPIYKNEIIVFGYSEGGMVVPKLALINKKVTKVVNIVGGGLNQFYDLILEQRINAQKGEITSIQAQKVIDSLFIEFETIYNNPQVIDKEFWDDTYLRWASFCTDIPMEDMTKLDIPILMISVGKDPNSPILGLDYVKIEFMRLRKTNLTYKVYPNCDHYFYDMIEKKDRLEEMMEYVLTWIEE
ncbi:MAG: hypothetical protein L3J29_10150 [Cyclobacteriaceae bacterium]|nr:hypothetical protein [Cyclobacteriaceae bacterium]